MSLSSNAHGKEDDKALTSGVDGQTDIYVDTQMHANKLVKKRFLLALGFFHKRFIKSWHK